MVNRRKAREAALQTLFQEEFPDTTANHSNRSMADDAELTRYAGVLIDGVRAHLGAIDSTIERFSVNWKIQRMALVDKNILRIAIFEMLHSTEAVPTRASINE